MSDKPIKAGDRLVVEDVAGMKHDAWALGPPFLGHRFMCVQVRFDEYDQVGIPWPLASVVASDDR